MSSRWLVLMLGGWCWAAHPAIAQTVSPDKLSPPSAKQFAPLPPIQEPPSQESLPEPAAPQPLPPPDELLRPSDVQPLTPDVDGMETLVVQQFEFSGNTVFSDADLAAALMDYTGTPITIDQLYEARSLITQVYVEAGYVTSGAFIPPQQLQGGVVQIEIVEGRLEGIEVRNNDRLDDDYISSRVALGADVPLNVNAILEQLQLLQLDPRIDNLTAELSAGPQFGTSLLSIDVVEADTFNVIGTLDNLRSPSVGEFRQILEINELNVAGDGETLELSYARTSGSNALQGSFEVFLNPRGGTLAFSTGVTVAEVIEEPFDQLNVKSESTFIELTYRQPIIQRLNEELALGLTASRQRTRGFLDISDEFGGEIPLSIGGADEDGVTQIIALRFFQEWLRRSTQDIFAVRSQFSLGLDALDSTVNGDGRPDSRFFAWRGQAQWLRLLEEDTILLVRGDVQLSTDSLVSLEQFGIGGQETLRGYRRDILLGDNGALLSAEARFPIWRVDEVNGLLQVAPFIDLGTVWNVERDDPDPSTLVGIGVGLLWQQDHLRARLDWGIPLVSVDGSEDDTWQESGVYFSIQFGLR
jgi:hemolysin activation/secretion protein